MIWNLDPTHANVDFSVKHMAISTVRGSFDKFTASGETDDATGMPTKLTMEIDAASVNTNNEQRDGHLRSPDFFDVANHPQIVFEATSFRREGDEYVVDGQLTMRGVTHPVTLRGEIAGPIKDPWGNERFAADLQGKVDRTKWGLKWNQVLEAGGLLVAEEVRFHAVVELVKVGEPVAA